ncbi:MAG TPA: hypothetical protein VMJ14_12555 [Burkholderiales bacterium]|nr:hypothetical protein [Burkholderiales bacterium]
MIAKIAALLVVYCGLSLAALLLLLIGFAMARSRTEVIGMGAISGALVAIHAGELVFLASLGQIWLGDGIDPLLVAGGALMLLAGALTVMFLRRGARPGFSDGMR